MLPYQETSGVTVATSHNEPMEIRTARQMDHLPISGPEGSLEQLAALPCRHRIYTHINNTNPMLVEYSPECAVVRRAGLTIGVDGLEINV